MLELVQVAVGRRLGIEEPQLMRIMRATLRTHTECFKLQQCKDQFEGFLKINCLKERSTTLFASPTATKSNSGSNNLGSSQATVSSSTHVSDEGGSPNQASSGDVWDENAILKVMVSSVSCYWYLNFSSNLEFLSFRSQL